MTKLYENCQRMAMITYANEMADACIPHGVDPFEVCSAAATKPFGICTVHTQLRRWRPLHSHQSISTAV
ncbi:hypothetical protein BGZ57DRAFT_891802 [Hyaloscypha finlandica]|nr:hypothetical protein BGZ57DRAFT_891802 [Hyaloscypha finlandica]